MRSFHAEVETQYFCIFIAITRILIPVYLILLVTQSHLSRANSGSIYFRRPIRLSARNCPIKLRATSILTSLIITELQKLCVFFSLPL